MNKDDLDIPTCIRRGTLPTDAKDRKNLPIYSGVMRYFPDALAEVAGLSKVGNDQHNPGQPLHWSKGKSTDHDDCIARHLIDAGTLDTDGVRHRTKVAWRALAALQIEIEAERAGLSYDAYIARLKAETAAPAAKHGEPSVEDAWIIWNGGDCPVPPSTFVDFRMRSEGMEGRYLPVRTEARMVRWDHDSYHPSDVIAYRVVKA